MYLETVTGRLVDISNPNPDSICIEDIGWGLSRISRFCGHTITAVPYNVSQHSLFVADELRQHSDRVQLLGLVHDAAEVYTGDWPSPVKRIPELRPLIKALEARLMAAIYMSFDIVPPNDEEEALIKSADRLAQKIEAHAFMPSRGRDWPDLPAVSLERLQQFEQPKDSITSYRLFMEKFKSLTGR